MDIKKLEKIINTKDEKILTTCGADFENLGYDVRYGNGWTYARGSVPVLIVSCAGFHFDTCTLTQSDDIVYSENPDTLSAERLSVYMALELAQTLHCSYLFLDASYRCDDDAAAFTASEEFRHLRANYIIMLEGQEPAAIAFYTMRDDFFDFAAAAGITPTPARDPHSGLVITLLAPAADRSALSISCGFNSSDSHINLTNLESAEQKIRALAAKKCTPFPFLDTPLTVKKNPVKGGADIYEITKPAVTKVISSDGSPDVQPTLTGLYLKHHPNPFIIQIPSGTTIIEANAFSDYENLDSVIIPGTVVEIGDNAFARCSHLKEITIPDSVREMGTGVFEECARLEQVRLSSNLRKISDGTFIYCSNLRTVDIPDSVTEIGAQAFYDAPLTAVKLPEHLEKIGTEAFQTNDLTSITIPDSVTEIGEDAFSENIYLAEVTLPNMLKTIGPEAFGECSSLVSITIPDGVTELPQSLFRLCAALQHVSLPHHLETVGPEAFMKCSSLSELTLPDTVTYIGEGAFAFTGITAMTLPPDLATLEPYTFLGCSSLARVTMHEGIEAIGCKVFDECPKLEQPAIPASVEYSSEE